MEHRLVVGCALLLAGCASRSSDLDARVRALEGEVAKLRVAVAARPAEPPQSADVARRAAELMQLLSAGCKDVSIPAGTQIDIPVAFDIGRSSTTSGDRITITEVRGTRPDFAVGGIYLVRGEYTLASAAAATIALGVGATDPHDACTMNNTRGRQHVVRGSGTFELATTFVHRGHPGISFFVEGADGSGGQFHGPGSGGVRFGKGDFSAE
jgi:hypothetical protein